MLKNEDTRTIGNDNTAAWNGINAVGLQLLAVGNIRKGYPLTVELDNNPARRVRVIGPDLEVGGAPFTSAKIIDGKPGDVWHLYTAATAGDARRQELLTDDVGRLMVRRPGPVTLFDLELKGNHNDQFGGTVFINPGRVDAPGQVTFSQNTPGDAWDVSAFTRVRFSMMAVDPWAASTLRGVIFLRPTLAPMTGRLAGFYGTDVRPGTVGTADNFGTGTQGLTVNSGRIVTAELGAAGSYTDLYANVVQRSSPFLSFAVEVSGGTFPGINPFDPANPRILRLTAVAW